MKRIYLSLIFVWCFYSSYAQGSFTDSLKLAIGTWGTVASKDYQPLWSVSNRFGAIRDQKSDLSTFISISNKHLLNDNNQYPGFSEDSPWSISYGADVYNNKHFGTVFFQQAYIKLNYGAWQLRGGRYKEIVGEMDADLSTGSLGISGNALPIPKVGIALTQYSRVPFTNGWLQVKGLFSHGWMGNNRYMKDAYLHEKTLYLRIGKNKLKLYGGIQHYAEWGGRRDDWTSLDRSVKGFMNVVLLKEADDGSVDYGDSVKTHRPNRAGDHRGVIEAGLEYDFERVKLNVYNQTPFDTGQGIDIRNIDRLFGISLTNKEDSFWRKFLAEFIYTRQMNDFYSAQYRESYYNNGVYKTGWEYEDRIIGTPLFINRQRGSKYFSEIAPYDWDAEQNTIPGNSNIINNQVIGGHIAALYTIDRRFGARSMITYTRNYGGNKVLKPHKDQCYTLQEVNYKLPSDNVLLTAGFAYDFGDLSKNFGMILGVKWQLAGVL